MQRLFERQQANQRYAGGGRNAQIAPHRINAERKHKQARDRASG